MGLPLRSAMVRYGLSPRTMNMPELGYIALMIFRFAGGRPIPVSASWVTSPVARPMSILPSAKSGGATGVRSPPSPVCLFMFVVSHLPQRVDSRAALLYHAPTLQRPGAELRKFSRGSVRARAGGLDYAAPLQRLVPHKLLQVLRRASDRP